MPKSKARAIVLAVAAILAVGAAGFWIGRTTASSGSPRAQCAQLPPGVDARGFGRIALPNGGTGWYDACADETERLAVIRKHRPAKHIDIYGDERGNHVIAWFYVDCDMSVGIVPPGTRHPVCPSTATTQVG